MIVSFVASKFIRNINDTEDSKKKTQMKYAKWWTDTQICYIFYKYDARNDNNINKTNFKPEKKKIDSFMIS